MSGVFETISILHALISTLELLELNNVILFGEFVYDTTLAKHGAECWILSVESVWQVEGLKVFQMFKWIRKALRSSWRGEEKKREKVELHFYKDSSNPKVFFLYPFHFFLIKKYKNYLSHDKNLNKVDFKNNKLLLLLQVACLARFHYCWWLLLNGLNETFDGIKQLSPRWNLKRCRCPRDIVSYKCA